MRSLDNGAIPYDIRANDPRGLTAFDRGGLSEKTKGYSAKSLPLIDGSMTTSANDIFLPLFMMLLL